MKAHFHESLYICGLHVNTCSIWDPSTLWNHCKWTTKLSAVLHNMSPMISSAADSISTCNFVWIGVVHMIFEVAPVKIMAGIHIWWTWPSKPLLADCTPHGAFCRMKLCFHYSIFEVPGPHILLTYYPLEVEMDFIIKLQAV